MAQYSLDYDNIVFNKNLNNGYDVFNSDGVVVASIYIYDRDLLGKPIYGCSGSLNKFRSLSAAKSCVMDYIRKNKLL